MVVEVPGAGEVAKEVDVELVGARFVTWVTSRVVAPIAEFVVDVVGLSDRVGPLDVVGPVGLVEVVGPVGLVDVVGPVGLVDVVGPVCPVDVVCPVGPPDVVDEPAVELAVEVVEVVTAVDVGTFE